MNGPKFKGFHCGNEAGYSFNTLLVPNSITNENEFSLKAHGVAGEPKGKRGCGLEGNTESLVPELL